MLEAIGLGQADETVDEALIRRSQATVADLVADSGLSAAATRRAVRSLLAKGLATRSSIRRPCSTTRNCHRHDHHGTDREQPAAAPGRHAGGNLRPARSRASRYLRSSSDIAPTPGP
jgi:hypothetical protein